MNEKTVLVTGVNGGIGKGLAAAFRADGWQVAGADITDAGGECDLYIEADISSPAGVKKVAAGIRDKYGKVGCIVNNAAVQVEKRLVDTTDEEWEKTFAVNVRSVFLIARETKGMMGAGSSIINISSVHSIATSSGLAAYAASKGALSALTRAMAIEFARDGIRVNSIAPGAIDTPMLGKGLSRAGDLTAAREKLKHTAPLGAIGMPKDVACLALFLADGVKSGNITGAEFVCDGGVLARLASE